MALLLIANTETELTQSEQWGELVERSGKNMLGFGLSIPIFTLTNWNSSTTKPQIAAGSIIEVGGSFYQADSDTALTDEGGISNGTVHIKLVPEVAPEPSFVTATLTNDSIPAWDATKQGWYDSDDKFLPYEMNKSSSTYTDKSEYVDQNKYVRLGVNVNGLEIKDKLHVDVINESSSGSGVTIDSVLVKDNTVTANTVTANTEVKTDKISEKTGGAGVTIDSVLLKDNTATLNTLTANTEIKSDKISEKTNNAGVSVQAKNGNQLITESFVIGPWNMDADTFYPGGISTGISNDKVASVSVLVFDDGGSLHDLCNSNDPANGDSGGWAMTISGTLSLTRTTGGEYDSTSYDLTSFDRGKVTIEYEI